MKSPYCMLLLEVFTLLFVGRNFAKILNEKGTDDTNDVFKEIELLRKEVDKLSKSNLEMSQRMSLLDKKDPILHARDPGPSDVFFSAQLRHAVRGIPIGEKIIYGLDFTNAGGGYNNNTGVFTAPTSGAYMFSFFCNSLKAQLSSLAIMIEGRLQLNCIVEPAYDGEDETGGNLFTTRLDVGDEVWVEAYYSDQTTIDLKVNVNTFSGILIHR